MRRATALAILLVQVLPACSGEAEQASPRPTATDPGSASQTTLDLTADGSTVSVSIELQDSRFVPSTIKVVHGASVEVHVENRGSQRHTFTIDEMPVDLEVQPGGSETARFELPGEGRQVTFSCRFHGTGGMKGAFVFGEGDQQADPDDYTPGY